MMRGSRPALLLGSLNALVVVVPFIGHVDGRLLLGWLLLFFAVRLTRLAEASRAPLGEAGSEPLAGRALWVLCIAAVQALVWGLGSWLLVAPGQLVAEAVLHVCLAIIVLANVLNLSRAYPVQVVYVLCVTVPLLLRDLWIGQIHITLAALSALLAVAALVLGYRQSRWLAEIQAQRQRNDGLIDELRLEVEARGLAQVQAEQAHAAKAQFLAAASHDLRQPLNAIGLLAQALPHEPGTQQLAQAAERIVQCVQQMGTIVDGLMELSRLESGTVVPEPAVFDIAPLLHELAAVYLPLARDKGLDLQVDTTSMLVFTDARLLQRVLSNLLSNAIRYTLQGSVRLEARQADGSVNVGVSDTGVGISSADLQRVFEPFFQTGNPGRDARQGYGLGLAIVRRLSELLSLNLQLSSLPGQGTSVALRLAPAPDAAAGIGVAAGGGSTQEQALLSDPLLGRRLLIVEDDPASCDALKRLLVGWGCQVRQAASADQALARLADDWLPECVVADLRLGEGGNGCETVMRLRGALGTALPAVLVTGDADSAQAKQAAEAGLVVLRKPLRAVQLRAFLSHALAFDASFVATSRAGESRSSIKG